MQNIEVIFIQKMLKKRFLYFLKLSAYKIVKNILL
jgi:hypothetical protein